MNSSKRSFFRLVGLVLLTRLADAVTTYIGSPDLRYELNPVVSVFHSGWLGLFLATATITGGLLYLAFLHYLRPLSYATLPAAGMRSLKDFAVYTSFGKKGKLSDFLYRIPKPEILARWLGYAGSHTLLYYGFFVVINNLLLIYPTPLTALWIALGITSRYIDLIFLSISMTVLSYYFFRQQYRQAQAQQALPASVAAPVEYSLGKAAL